MSDNYDPMSPSYSPNAIKKTGVRRVNNIPLIIVVSAFIVFIGIVAMVAAKRADQQNVVQKKESHNSRNTDTSAMAAEIVGGRTSGIIPSEKIPTIPIAKVNDPDAPPTPPRLLNDAAPLQNPALNQIQSAKMQEFENAVEAKTSISLPPMSSPVDHSQLRNSMNSVHSEFGQANSGDINSSYQAKLQKIRANMIGGESGGASNANVGLNQNNSMAKNDRWKLNSQVEAPSTPYEIRAGGVIPGVMISGINSELPGQIMGQVSQDVFDTATGKYLLIPQGTRLIGTYSNNIVYGQSAVLIAWQRLVFPDGKTLDIGEMPGADSAGYSGFRDQVDNHYVRIFGSAFLMTGVVAGIAYSQDQNNNTGLFSKPTASSELSEALGQQLGQVTAQMIAKNLNIAPTIMIRPGYRFNIVVTKDMPFSIPYKSFNY
jgi:type IV secretory pathway VirB10-like protein